MKEAAMAETEAPKKTTRPSRARSQAPAKATPAKAAAPKLEETTVVVEPTEDTKAPLKLVLVKLPDTKSYSVFTGPEGSNVVGKLYFPLGTTEVKVLAL